MCALFKQRCVFLEHFCRNACSKRLYSWGWVMLLMGQIWAQNNLAADTALMLNYEWVLVLHILDTITLWKSVERQPRVWSTKPANVWLSSLAATIAEVAVYENCRIMFVLLRANSNIRSEVFWCYGTFLADLTTVQYSSVNKDCLIAHHGWEFALFRMYFVYVAYVAGIEPIQFFWPNCFTLSQYVQFRAAHSHSHY